MSNKRYYFDYNATTPVHPVVRERMVEVLCTAPGNPSSLHQEGQRARGLLEQARRRVADLLDASPMEIYFTSGGTEANNLALLSVLRGEPCEVMTSLIEHPSILTPLKRLADEGRIELKYVPLKPDGELDLQALNGMLTQRTRLVTFMLVNNEIGTIYPLSEIAALCRAREAQWGSKIHLHCDGIQAVGRLPVSPRRLGVDSLSFSGHKFYGPKGVGGLWVREDGWLKPLLHGGGQEAGIRSGTENLPGIVGMGEASELARKHQQQWGTTMQALRDRLEQALLRSVEGCRVNAQQTPRIFSTSNLHFKGVPGDLLHQSLDLRGCAVSTGSACCSGTVSGSPVLKALGQSPQEASQAIRVSLGYDTTAEDIDALVAHLRAAVDQVRQVL